MDKAVVKLKDRVNNLNKSSQSRIDTTFKFINEAYTQRENLNECMKFTEDMPLGVNRIAKIGFEARLFTTVEAVLELQNSLILAANCFYKSSFDSLRRAIEIILVGIYFNLEEGNKTKSKQLSDLKVFKWLESNATTPFFSDITKKIYKDRRFIDIIEKTDFSEKLSNLYYSLSDITHTQGLENSIYIMNMKGEHIFSEDSLRNVLDKFIDTVKIIAIIYAIVNPILLVPLPLFKKFFISYPIFLFNEEQSNTLRNLIPENYRKIVQAGIDKDADIQHKIAEIKEMPDSSEYIEFMEKNKLRK